MPDKLLETMPLRDRIREAEHLCRELAEHLELDVRPKIHTVRTLTRKEGECNAEHITDATIRNAVDTALVSHEYTIELTRNLDRLLDSINREAGSVVSGDRSDLA